MYVFVMTIFIVFLLRLTHLILYVMGQIPISTFSCQYMSLLLLCAAVALGKGRIVAFCVISNYWAALTIIIV